MFNNFYNPYSVSQAPTQRISLINKVNGYESAKAFQTQPNCEVAWTGTGSATTAGA